MFLMFPLIIEQAVSYLTNVLLVLKTAITVGKYLHPQFTLQQFESAVEVLLKMDDQACPRCKTTKYRNPSLKLMVNVCGHGLCESCVEMLFVKGSGSCPECGIPLRRNAFRLQLFEDPVVEKEVDIRKKILRDYNKREEDFATLREYNDYLEEIENIVYNLTYNQDVETTKKQIEQYKRDNKDQIVKNRARLGKDQEFIEEMIELEQHEVTLKRQQIFDDEIAEKKAKRMKEEALIDDLMFSDAPVGSIMAMHSTSSYQKPAPQATTVKPHTGPVRFSTGIKGGIRGNEFLPVPKIEEGPAYSYEEIVIDLCGPDPPGMGEMSRNGYLLHVRAATDGEKAGGFLSEYACFRAMQDGFCGLFFVADDDSNTWNVDTNS